MTEKPTSKTWREKTLPELDKGDWLYAIKACPEYKRESLLKDIAYALADHWNRKHRLTWVSGTRIAFLLDTDESKVSTRIQRMVKDGALNDVPRDEVPSAVIALCRGKDKRGKFFSLNLMWAFEIAERLNNRDNSKICEPSQLRKGRQKVYCDSKSSKSYTVTVNQSSTVTVNDLVYCDSKAKPECETREELKEALREKKAPLRAREDNSYLKAKDGEGVHGDFPIPSNETEARQLIVRLLDGKRPLPAQMLALQHMLMNGTLRQWHIDDLEDAA
ncbi:MAG: hypothetical protein WBA36_18910 [Mesorhizobium sp.]